jgi:hypothetical protein
MHSPTFSSTDLELLGRQLEQWRRQQSGGYHLPPEVWTAAVHLAATHGVSRVSRSLGLGFHRLRRRCSQLPQAAPTSSKPTSPALPTPQPTATPSATPPSITGSSPRFVELKLDAVLEPSGVPCGWVEFSHGEHRRMRLQTGHDPAAWVSLVRAFWEAAP